MSNAVILNVTDGPNVGIGLQNDRAVIAYKNLVTSVDQFTVGGDQSEKPFLVDNMTTTSWKAPLTSAVITIDGVAGSTIDCVALSPSNWQTAGAGIKIDIESASGTETVFNNSGFKDDAPVLVAFDEVIAVSVTITITTTSQLYFTGFYVGKCLHFPCGVSVGYQPAKWTSSDQVNTFKTESNAFGQSTVFKRGSVESFTVENINQTFMDSDWVDFIRNAIGYQVWFAWDTIDHSNDVVYGSWSIPRPTYTSSIHSSVSMEIQGVSS